MILVNEQRRIVTYLDELDLTPVPSPRAEGCLLAKVIDAHWDKFWTEGLSNLLDAIEQFSLSTDSTFAKRPGNWN